MFFTCSPEQHLHHFALFFSSFTRLFPFFVAKMDKEDKFPLHTAAREGRGELLFNYTCMTTYLGYVTNKGW